MSTKKRLNVTEILDRAKKAAGVKTDSRLSEILGVDRTTVSVWRRRNTVDVHILSTFCQQFAVSMDWLFLGVDHAAPPADDVTGKILQMLEGMDDEQRRDILRYTQKTELLEELLRQRRA